MLFLDNSNNSDDSTDSDKNRDQNKTIILTQNEFKKNVNSISYLDVANNKYRIVRDDPNIDEWIKHLDCHNINYKKYQNTDIIWDDWKYVYSFYCNNYGFWTIIPNIINENEPHKIHNLLNDIFYDKSDVLYYNHSKTNSINIFETDNVNSDNEKKSSMCIEFSFVVKLSDHYIYFDYVGYTPLDDSNLDKYIGNIKGGIGKIVYAKNWKLFVKLIK